MLQLQLSDPGMEVVQGLVDSQRLGQERGAVSPLRPRRLLRGVYRRPHRRSRAVSHSAKTWVGRAINRMDDRMQTVGGVG